MVENPPRVAVDRYDPSYEEFIRLLGHIPPPTFTRESPFPTDKKQFERLLMDQDYYYMHLAYALCSQLGAQCSKKRVKMTAPAEFFHFMPGRGGRHEMFFGVYDEPAYRAMAARTPTKTHAEPIVGVTFTYNEADELVCLTGVPGSREPQRLLGNMGKTGTSFVEEELRAIQAHMVMTTIKALDQGRLTLDPYYQDTGIATQSEIAAKVFFWIQRDANDLCEEAGLTEPVVRTALRFVPGKQDRQEILLAAFHPQALQESFVPDVPFNTAAQPVIGRTFTFDDFGNGLFLTGLPETSLKQTTIKRLPNTTENAGWDAFRPLYNAFQDEIKKALVHGAFAPKPQRDDQWAMKTATPTTPAPGLGTAKTKK